MPRNIEIKARIASIESLLPAARAAAGGAEPERIDQDDSFFVAAHGRLKLRVFESGQGELIAYQRADQRGPKASDYVRAPVAEPALLREALTRALGSAGRVRKTRWLLLAGRTRIHLDRVAGLGDYVELEVVLRDGEAEADGVAEAHALLARLGVPDDALEAGAYVDLLAKSSAGIASARKS